MGCFVVVEYHKYRSGQHKHEFLSYLEGKSVEKA